LSQLHDRAALPTDPKELVIVVDFDGTITDYKEMIKSDASTFMTPPEPAAGVKSFLHSLMMKGCTVIVNSARLTPAWQVDKPWAKAAEKYSSIPLEQAIIKLQKDLIADYMSTHDLLYDSIEAGKPHAHYYIDDRAYNPILSSWMEILNTILKTG